MNEVVPRRTGRRVNVGIVTGAARGMGRACATCMVDCLLLVDRDEHLLGKAVDEMKASGAANVELFALDITDGEGIARLVSASGGAGHAQGRRSCGRHGRLAKRCVISGDGELEVLSPARRLPISRPPS